MVGKRILELPSLLAGSSGRLRAGRLFLMAFVLAGLLMLPFGAGATVKSVIVFQPSAGADYMIYAPDTGEDMPLPGTARMGNAVLGDVDGDGMEDDLVYRDTTTGMLGYYEIPGDGKWHPERDFPLPASAMDPIPQTVLRTGTTGPAYIIYSSFFDATSYAVTPDGTEEVAIGTMDKAFAVDARGQGFKGDILWQAGGNVYWREGITGADHGPSPHTGWEAYGGGKLIPNQPERGFVFYTDIPSGNSACPYLFAVCDKDWNATTLGGVNSCWGPATGRPWLSFGDLDGDGLDSIVFCNTSGAPLQFYSPPGATDDISPWDQSRYVNTTKYTGCLVTGVAKVDIGLIIVPLEKISDISQYDDGVTVKLTKVRTLSVRDNTPQTVGFYIEEPDRTAGLRCVGTTVPSGGLVTVTGTLNHDNGERVLEVMRIDYPVQNDSYVVDANGANLTGPVGAFDEVVSGDIRNVGYKGDLLWRTANQAGGALVWREGVSGTDHVMGGGDWHPRAVGSVVPNQPERRICFYSDGANAFFMLDPAGGFTWIGGTNAGWGQPITLADVNGDGLDDIVFYNVVLQWYSPPASHDMGGYWLSDWNQNNYVADNVNPWSVWSGHIGVATMPGGAKYVVGRKAGNGILMLQDINTFQLSKLEGTQPMSACYIGDCDGDGFEDDIVYQNSNDGSMGYYEIPLDGAWHPENNHIILRPQDQARPAAIVRTQASGNPAQILYRKYPVVSPLSTSLRSLSGPGVPMTGLMVRVAGAVTATDPVAGSFTLSDGSPAEVKVYCADVLPLAGSFVTVRGCVGAETSGAGTVPVIRVPGAGGAIMYAGAVGGSWEFNTDGDLEGWGVGNQVTGLQASGGNLVFDGTGGDPFIGVLCNADADANQHVDIRMRVSAGATGGIVFIAGDGIGSVQFPITADGDFHDYHIDMSVTPHWGGDWAGTLQYLRLDVPDDGNPAHVEIDYVRLVP